MVDDDDDGRTTPDHDHPISSPCEPNGSGELINAEATSWAGLVENLAFVLAWTFFAEYIWTNVLPSRYINRRRKFISWTQWPQ